ncbi:MAG: branched-chain amino acid ABC transporter permease [Hyphomicrobiales bacterium]|nr:branched-chain amino acid ABC transporter permease [Hyphomicrobiales bacterium]
MSQVPYPRPCGDFRSSYAADMTMFRTRGATLSACAAFVLVAALPLFAGDYVLSQLILIGIYGIAALGLNVLVGFTGQISLGHSAFFGFGAFASAWLGTAHGVPPLLSIPLAGIATTVLGMLFGLPAARLKGLYLAIATLASQLILEDFFARADWLTGGSSGAPAERASLFGLALENDRTYFYVVLFWFVLSYVGVANLMRTRDGRALIAVRDHYLSAEVMGINLTRYRILSFGISSFFAGIGGALYAHYLGFVSSEAFTILLSIQFLAMVIIGGLGSVAGSALGTAFILLLPQVMHVGASTLAELFPAMQQGVAYIKEMSIGAAIILFLIFEPEGLIHRWRLIRASFKLYPFSY